jgi:hypothetical protein
MSSRLFQNAPTTGIVVDKCIISRPSNLDTLKRTVANFNLALNNDPMTTMLSCPYCNSQVPAVDAPKSGRMPCPRCGESFVVGKSDLPAESQVSTSEGDGRAELLTPATKRRNRGIALLVLAGMLVLAIAATLFMLDTRSKRGLRKLAEHPALGYLPDDTDAIIAVNVPMAEQSKEGRDMIDRLGLGEGGMLNLEKITGLKLDQIEDAMVGLHMAEKPLVPDFCVVVRTRGAYDAGELRNRLGSKASKKDGERAYNVVQPPGLPLEFSLWCPSSRTFVLCYPPDRLVKTPVEPNVEIDRFAPSIADLLRYRSDRDTFFWIVAHAEDWNKTSLPALRALKLLPFTENDMKTVNQVRTFGLGLRVDKGVISSRNRPARITEEVKPGPKGIAMDLVVITAGGTDMPAVRESLESWIERQKLDVRDTNLDQNRYTLSVIGTPEEWERALKALMDRVPKK